MKDRMASFFLTATFFFLSSAFLLAQSTQPPSSSSSQVAISATTGKEATCEGGAEIIPSGQQSFARKRYVAIAAKPKIKLTKPRARK